MQISKVGTQRGKERNRKEGRRGTMPSENSVLKRSAANINSCPTISKKWFRTKPDNMSKHLRHKDIHFDGTGKFWYHILGLFTIVWAPTSLSAASSSRKARLSPVASEAAPKYLNEFITHCMGRSTHGATGHILKELWVAAVGGSCLSPGASLVWLPALLSRSFVDSLNCWNN